MKKVLIALSFILSFVPFSLAQAPVLSRSYGFTTTGTTDTMDVASRGLNYYRIQWSNRANTAPSVCTLVLQTSNDGSTWSTGISGTCTSNATSALTQITTNYIRLNLSAYTPGATRNELVVDIIGYNDINAATISGGSVTSITDPVVVKGSTAIDSAYSGVPVNIACKALSAEQTAVTTGDEVNCITDLVGKLIIIPYANPENFVQGGTAAITDTTSTSVIVSAGGSLRNYITHCTVSNSHATVGTFVKILDGSTIIDEVYAAAAGGGASLTYPTPLRGTAATAINAQPVTTGANVIVFCNGYKGL